MLQFGKSCAGPRGCEGEPGGKVVTSFACCNAAFHYNGVSTGFLRVL